MPDILFPTQSAPGRDPQESAGRLINAWAGVTQEGAGSVNIIRPTPGLRSLVDTGQNGPRGFRRVGNRLYAAFHNALVLINQNHDSSFIAALDGSQPIDIAVNNRTPIPDVVAVTENGAFSLTDTSVTAFADADLPQPNSVCEMDGYFIFSIADGRMFASGLNSTSVAGTDFARAEARQGGLVRVVTFRGQLFAFKATSIEVWANTAEPTGFPFSRVAGGVIDRGLLAPRALAGVQEGFATALIWVGDDGAVNTLDGYNARPISSPDVERSIAQLSDKSALRAYVYVFDGQPIWSLSCPEFTWEYNLRLNRWNEGRSYGLERRRISETVFFDGKWLCGDVSSSHVMEITSDAQDEEGDPLIFEAHSIVMGAFPTPYRVGRTEFDCLTGVGVEPGADPIQTDPCILVDWSDDGGRNFGMPASIPLGRQGHGRQRLTLPRQLGRAGPKGRVWRVRRTDPVPFALLGGNTEALPGRK